QIQRLMPDELVRKTERCVVEHARLGQHNRVFQRPTSDQTTGLKLLHLMVETECSRRRDEVRIIRTGKSNVDALPPDQRMGKIDIILKREVVGRVDADRLIAIMEHKLLRNPDVLSPPVLFVNSGASDSFGKRQSTAIEDRNFEIVEFNVRIIDPDAVERRKQM